MRSPTSGRSSQISALQAAETEGALADLAHEISHVVTGTDVQLTKQQTYGRLPASGRRPFYWAMG
jgi:hypothetical protein